MKMRQTLAVLSDIHGNSWALDAVLEDIASRGIKDIINLGDSLYGPLDPAGTAERLLAHNIPSVRGNQDRFILESQAGANPTWEYVNAALRQEHREWLAVLPFSLSDEGGFYACHGTPAADNEYLLEHIGQGRVCMKSSAELTLLLAPVEAGLVLCGHSHLSHFVYLDTRRIIFNPGSVGLPAYSDDLPEYHRMESFNPHAKYGILTNVAGCWQADFAAVAYDWEAASRTAAKNMRPDWAGWLLNGRAVQ